MFAKILFALLFIKHATSYVEIVEKYKDFNAQLLYHKSNEDNFNFLISPYGVIAVANKIIYFSFDTSRKQLEDAIQVPDEDIIHLDNREKESVENSRNSGLTVVVNEYLYIVKELITNESKREMEPFDLTIEVTDSYEIDNSALNYVTPIGNSVTTKVTAELDGDAKIEIINVLSMAGEYGLPFHKFDTKLEFFYNEDDVQLGSVNMMSGKGTFLTKTSKYLNVEAISLPYGKANKYTFYIFKPNKGVKIADVLKKLNNCTLFYDGNNDVFNKLVSVKVPRFMVNKHTGVIEALKHMNVIHVFEENPNNFAKFTNERLQITKFYQKVDVQIIEPTYTDTPLYNSKLDIPEIEFHCNKPFIYYLIKRDQVLFSGIYSKPSIY